MPRKQPTTLAECNAKLELAQNQLRQYQKPGEDAKTKVERRGTQHQNAPPLRPWRLYGKHRAGAENHDGGRGEGLFVSHCKGRGRTGVFEKTSQGGGSRIIPLVTRAHFYTGASPVCALCEANSLDS